MRALVTGGAGFIGSALVLRLLSGGHDVLNIDKLTYAADMRNLDGLETNARYAFHQGDVADQDGLSRAVKAFDPDVMFHLAAESHVDRSIDAPQDFIRTNVLGTFAMLQVALEHSGARQDLRFVHVSTDEVYGSVPQPYAFTEASPYAPNSPYAASKAGSDCLVRAWHRTYGLQTLISNCSNNYGPRQNAEKLIPTIIRKALLEQSIPIYGDGTNVRDWLHVDDHVDALLSIAEHGRIGEKYNIGGDSEVTNNQMASFICAYLDDKRPRRSGRHADLVTYVTDRPGHDARYAIDAGKAAEHLRWTPAHTFETGMADTIDWYLEDTARWMPRAGEGGRLGMAGTHSK